MTIKLSNRLTGAVPIAAYGTANTAPVPNTPSFSSDVGAGAKLSMNGADAHVNASAGWLIIIAVAFVIYTRWAQ